MERSDPYLEAFRNKNIRYAVVETDSDFRPDTISFDKLGNVVRIWNPFYREKRGYDSEGFLVRLWHYNDFTTSLVANYSWSGDTVNQSWRAVVPTAWELTQDTSSVRYGTPIRFIVNKAGKILEEKNPSLNEMIKYIYVDNKLARKEGYMVHPRGRTKTWIYDYDSSGNIARISFFRGDHESEVHYYTKGLLDSTIVKDPEPYKSIKKFKYIYY